MACSSLTFASVASEIGLEESDLDALQEACSTEDFGDGDFLERIWPLIVSLAAQNDNKTDSEPARLPRGKAGCVHVPRCTVAAILARAFMGKHGVAFNFVPLFAVPADDARRPVAVAKIRCVLAYFKAIYVDGGEASRLLEGAVTFTRVHESVAPGCGMDVWRTTTMTTWRRRWRSSTLPTATSFAATRRRVPRRRRCSSPLGLSYSPQ